MTSVGVTDRVMDAVAERLAAEPAAVLPTLRLIAGLDVLPADPAGLTDDAKLLSLARVDQRHSIVKEQSYTTGQVRQLLGGISRQAVSQRVASGSLIAADLAGRKYFPAWQFTEDGTVPGLPVVLETIAATGIGVVQADIVMRTALPEEDGATPAELLQRGQPRLAAHYVAALAGGH